MHLFFNCRIFGMDILPGVELNVEIRKRNFLNLLN